MFIKFVRLTAKVLHTNLRFEWSNKRDFSTKINHKTKSKIIYDNRCEIAVRAIRACNELSIKLIGISSKEDCANTHRFLTKRSDFAPVTINARFGFIESTSKFVQQIEEIFVFKPVQKLLSYIAEILLKEPTTLLATKLKPVDVKQYVPPKVLRQLFKDHDSKSFTKVMSNHRSLWMDTICRSAHRSYHQGPLVNHESLEPCCNIQEQLKVQYDIIAEKYLQIRSSLLIFEVVEYTLFKQLNFQLSGESVIDLACGNGICTRKLKKMGAGKTVGIDISEKMIGAAIYEENINPLGIKYMEASVDEMQIESETFDIATAFFLLHYAKSKMQLILFFKNIYSVLKKGGKFLSIYNNIEKHFCLDPRYLLKYGYIFTIEEPLKTGSQVTITLNSGNLDVDLHIYYYTQEDYKEAAKIAGFTEVDFLRLDFPEHMKGAPYWNRLNQYNLAHLMVCKK